MNKKGQISPAVFLGIVGVVITLVALGIVLSTSQKSMSTIRDSAAENKQASAVNEKLTFVNNTVTPFAQKSVIDVVVFAYSGLAANGNNVTLKQGGVGGNYSVTYSEAGSFMIPLNQSGRDWYNNSIFWVNYTYTYGSTERNITLTGQEGVKVLQDFQPTWATVIAVFIVITIVIGLATIVYTKMA